MSGSILGVYHGAWVRDYNSLNENHEPIIPDDVVVATPSSIMLALRILIRVEKKLRKFKLTIKLMSLSKELLLCLTVSKLNVTILAHLDILSWLLIANPSHVAEWEPYKYTDLVPDKKFDPRWLSKAT